ncbi:MAG: hypothetical protein B1H04_05650 [Planctomycetales bacterium 4484_123]|nr:MAG: hypothetical protein B1H04_05650 [Planctomycetales bacterium 4484_123]
MEEMRAITKGGSTFPHHAASRWLERLRSWVRAANRDRAARRTRRVVLLVMVLWILNIFDLVLTLLARTHEHFEELNPLAAPLLDNPAALICFKLVVVALASLILLRFRRHPLTEIGCWGASAAYSALAGVWWLYYLLC